MAQSVEAEQRMTSAQEGLVSARYETVPEYVERGGVITVCDPDPRIKAMRSKGLTARSTSPIEGQDDEAVSELPVLQGVEA